MKLFRNKLLLVGAVCVAPFVLGSLAYLLRWTPGNAGNYGELIEPRGLPGPPLDALSGKWVLVIFDGAACDAHCEKKLYIIRQVRRAQGKDMERIERLWLITDGGVPRQELLAAIEGTRVVHRYDPALPTNFPGSAPDHIYLVDPLGNLVTLTGALGWQYEDWAVINGVPVSTGTFTRKCPHERLRYALSIAAKRLLRASATVG